MNVGETYVTFESAASKFAVPVAPVLEILDARDITPLPRMPAFLLGLIDRRGASVPVVDLRRITGMEDCEDSVETRIIVIQLSDAWSIAHHCVGLRVDRVIEVTELDNGTAPQLAEADRLHWNEAMVAGIGRRGKEFVTVLDVEGMFVSDLKDVKLDAVKPG